MLGEAAMRIWTGNNRCGLLVRLVLYSSSLCTAALVLLQVCDNLLSAQYPVPQMLDVKGARVSMCSIAICKCLCLLNPPCALAV